MISNLILTEILKAKLGLRLHLPILRLPQMLPNGVTVIFFLDLLLLEGRPRRKERHKL